MNKRSEGLKFSYASRQLYKLMLTTLKVHPELQYYSYDSWVHGSISALLLHTTCQEPRGQIFKSCFLLKIRALL